MSPRGLILVLLISVSATSASALGCAGGKKDSDRPSYSITVKVAEKLKKVGELADKKDYEGALTALDNIAESKYLNPLEQATIWNIRAGLHLATEKTDEIPKDLEMALSFNALPLEREQEVRFNLGQAYFMSERFSEAADTFAIWAQNQEAPDPKQLYVVASSFAQAKRFKEALPYAEKAAEGMKPQPTEELLAFLVSVYYELDMQKEIAATQERMVALYPKNQQTWLQLSASYEALGDKAKARAILEKAQQQGVLTDEKAFLALAHDLLQKDKPQECAELIEKHMEAGQVSQSKEAVELVAACWLKAKNADNAEAALAKGGDALENGEAYFELGRLQIARSHWTKAREAFEEAFHKGKLKATGEAKLLFAVAQFHSNQKGSASAALQEARKDSRVSRCADVWLKIVKSGKVSADAGCHGIQPIKGGR